MNTPIQAFYCTNCPKQNYDRWHIHFIHSDFSQSTIYVRVKLHWIKSRLFLHIRLTQGFEAFLIRHRTFLTFSSYVMIGLSTSFTWRSCKSFMSVLAKQLNWFKHCAFCAVQTQSLFDLPKMPFICQRLHCTNFTLLSSLLILDQNEARWHLDLINIWPCLIDFWLLLTLGIFDFSHVLLANWPLQEDFALSWIPYRCLLHLRSACFSFGFLRKFRILEWPLCTSLAQNHSICLFCFHGR